MKLKTNNIIVLILFLVAILYTSTSFSQKLYLALNSGHKTVDIETCGVIPKCQFAAGTIRERHYLSNGIIIGVTRSQTHSEIYEVDTITCTSMQIANTSFYNTTQSSTMDEKENIWILSWQRLIKYDPKLNSYKVYGNIPSFASGVCFPITYRDNSLIYTNCEESYRFMKIDTNNTKQINTMYFYNHYLVLGMASFKTQCEDWITYGSIEEVDSINHFPIQDGFKGIGEIDFEAQRFYQICDIPNYYPILSQESIYYDKECILELDLDGDDSSNATAGDYQIATCAYRDIPISDDDVFLHSNTRIDSMHIYIESGLLDGSAEQLYIANTMSQIVTGNNSSDIWIKNIEPYYYAEMEEMIRTIGYNNISSTPHQGQRQIHFVAYYRGNESSPAICYMDLYNELQTAGSDHQISICQPDNPIALDSYLDAEAVGGGEWSPSTATGGIFAPGVDAPGIYTYIVQASDCAADTSYFDISFDAFDFDLGSDTTLCGDDNWSLAAPTEGDYLWSDGSQGSELAIVDTGYYWLEIINDQGCQYRDSIYVQRSRAASLTKIDTMLCMGDTLHWQGLTIYHTGVYLSRLSNEMRCDSLIELEVTVLAMPHITIVGDSLYCDGRTIQLGVIDTFDQYLWSNGEYTPNTTISESGSYRVTVTNLAGCSTVDSISVQELAPIKIEVNAVAPYCANESDGWIQLQYLSGGLEPLVYYIDEHQLGAELILEGLSSGQYDIRAIDAAGCEWTSVENLSVPEDNNIALGADLTLDTVMEIRLHIDNDLDLSTIAEIIWIANGDTIANNTNLDMPLTIQQTTTIKVYLTDTNGCTYYDEQYIKLEVPTDIYLPNVFTPDGLYPDFIVSSSYAVSSVIEFSIYDRWGGQMFHRTNIPTNDPSQSWDGTKGNVACEVGVYVYKVVYKVNGQLKEVVGDVLLLR